MSNEIINSVLSSTRKSTLLTINALINENVEVIGAYKPLYDILTNYPFREGKSLRPAICISIARSVGGIAQNVLVSSTAIELFHNAALIHDDIEDDSDLRRGQEAIHHLIGTNRAVNLGDATQVMSLSLLLKNLNIVGVAKSMQILHEIENMARQSVEGQAIELDWIANKKFNLSDDDYIRMCTKKTCWYTFISPCRIGYILGSQNKDLERTKSDLALLTEFGMFLGIAFQIQDDLLNLKGEEDKYGKEIGGDIFEGKRTIMLNHLIAFTKGQKRNQIIKIMSKFRKDRTVKDVKYILEEMNSTGSIEYAENLAIEFSRKAKSILNKMNFLKSIERKQVGEIWEGAFADIRFINALVDYVTQRNL